MLLSPAAQKRYAAFWANDAWERCCMFISIRSKAEGRPKPANIAQAWEDAELRTRQAVWDAANRAYYAEGFPNAFVNFGPGSLAAMIGGTYRWAGDTVWFENEPIITDWAFTPTPILHRDSPMYRMADTLTESLLDAGAGRFFTSLTDIGGTWDILAALRGTQALLLDLYDHPKAVLAYVQQLQPVWLEYFRQYASRLLARQGCVTNWMAIWSDLPWYPLQCDFSAMISPEMFAKFVLPDLRWQTEHMDRSVYHLDGPDALPHLRHLLSLPRLNAIQWTPGTGNASTTDESWFGLYEEIQAAGKGLVIFDVAPEKLERLLRHVSAKGLYLGCHARDEAEAREMVRMAEGAGVR